MMTAVWKALIAQKAQKISNRYLAVVDGVLDVPYDKVKADSHRKVAVRFVFISVLIIVISVVLIIAVCVAVRLT